MPASSRSVVESRAARPLRHWSADALARARGAVERALVDWGRRWGLDARVRGVLNAVDAPAASGRAWAGVADDTSWIAAESGPVAAALDGLLFDTPIRGADSIGRDVAAASLADLLEHLARLASTPARRDAPPADAPPATDGRRWSGAVVMELVLDRGGRDDRLWLHCSERVSGVLCGGAPRLATAAGRAPISGVAPAISRRPLRLTVRLDDSPVTLGMLQSLHPGDVLPLNHRLDASLNVSVADPAGRLDLLCAAYLGRRGPSRAVELVARASVSQQDQS